MIKYLNRLRSNTKKNKLGDINQPKTVTEVDGKAYTEQELEDICLTSCLEENLSLLKEMVGANVDFVTRRINIGRSEIRPAAMLFFDNLIDPDILDQHIVRPLVLEAYSSGLHNGPEIIEQVRSGNLITRAEIKAIKNFRDIIEGLLIGEVLLLIEGMENGLLINSKGYKSRSISEPDAEPVVRGPRDAFVETISINISLIRRRILSPNLVIESLQIGKVTRTKVCLAYIKGICHPELVKEVQSRLSRINIDSILESGYLEDFIKDNPYSPFPLIGVTERPDRATAAMLEGRVVIFTDNTPMALIAPGEFFSLMQAAEDYYNKFVFSTLIRLLRYIGFTMALLLPASYIAISTYHQEMIPTQLLVSIMAARSGVPVPAFLEALLMEFAFELLREAGVRLPRPLGQAVSIVGALVIGQAAVQAGIVSPLMVIVVAVTGIANFTIPQINISLAVRTLRFPLMFLAAFLGLFGLMTGIIVILLHLFSLRSFGVPYMSPISPFKPGDLKDTLVRAPMWAMVNRPTQTTSASQRMEPQQKPDPGKHGDGP
ncbi:spore germination protein [Desulfotomaculum defluvii]